MADRLARVRSAQTYEPINASEILALLTSGEPVIMERVEVYGNLSLPQLGGGRAGSE